MVLYKDFKKVQKRCKHILTSSLCAASLCIPNQLLVGSSYTVTSYHDEMFRELNSFCIFFLEHSPHVGMRYGEIPKSCTMENRTNIEHQLYATIQRKQPPVPPFTGATNVSKGFDTIDRLKMVR